MYTKLVSITLLVASCLAQGASVNLPQNTHNDAQVSLGEGRGTLTTAGDGVLLEGRATVPGKYAENWIMDAALLDYYLPQPVALPRDCQSLGFDYQLDQEKSGRQSIGLRTLIRDSQGGVWSVGTRLGARRSELNKSFSPIPADTYAFDINEAGRIDRWVMMPLDDKIYDEYDAPQPPFMLLGFRIFIQNPNGTPFSVQLSNLYGKEASSRPSPYWALVPQETWKWRQSIPALPIPEVHGWGEDSAPALTASALNVSPGSYLATWEILDLNERDVVGSEWEYITVAGPDTVVVQFPLLPAGTYQLRFSIRGDKQNVFQTAFYNYVILRNEDKALPEMPQHKLLSFQEEAPGVCLLRSSDQSGRILWRLESSDQRLLKAGGASSKETIRLDLEQWTGQESAVWLSAILENEQGRQLDVINRVVGLGNVESNIPEAKAAIEEPKFDLAFEGQMLRTKGDWAEGVTSAAILSKNTMSELVPWLDEAVEIGYNSVELGARWDDLNPLPGIYQFEYLDKLVNAARERGLFVTLRLHPIAKAYPTWLRREYMQDQYGYADGVWGGGNNLIASPSSEALKKAFDDYLYALGSHYRNDPTVVGYVLESIFFDHDLVDMPWLGQFVDYSEAAIRGFQRYLEQKYAGHIQQLNEAYGTDYHDWTDVPAPLPELLWSEDGRLMPRLDRAWQDWMSYKIKAIRDFRISGMEALRRADPYCWIGFYKSASTPFYQDEIEAASAWITYGSMESQYPMPNTKIRGRFEPHGKIARTKPLTDVGLSNILMTAPPGTNGLFNYWRLNRTLATASSAEREAELRLKTWFAIVDELVGATPVKSRLKTDSGAYLVSPAAQVNLLQHAFTGRADDFLKPWQYRLGADDLYLPDVELGAGEDASALNRYAYLYVPYATNALDAQAVDELEAYVKEGNRLVVEANSGYWTGDKANALSARLGLPEVQPVAVKGASPQEVVTWEADAPMASAPLSFRTQEFDPPTDNQATPWIHNIPRAFLRPYRLAAPLPADAQVLAHFDDGSPAAVLVPHGKGEVLVFSGVVDWIGSPGLARALDAWGRGQTPIGVTESKEEATVLSEVLRKGDDYFLVGRRFMNHAQLEQLKKTNDAPQTDAAPMTLRWDFGDLPSGSYHVWNLLDKQDLGVHTARALSAEGGTLALTPGQGFVLKAQPVGSAVETASASSTQSASASGEPEKKLFAHYMGCFPVGSNAMPHHKRKSVGIRHDSDDPEEALGGRYLTWPLTPDGDELTLRESADLDIRRAMRSGIDGFDVDAWAGGEYAQKYLDVLFEVAESEDYPFELTICLDPGCLPAGKEGYVSAIRYLLDRHGDSPKLARRNGKPLIFGFSSRGLVTRQGVRLDDPDNWPKIAQAYREIEEEVGQPLYFHFDLSNFFAGYNLTQFPGTRPPHEPGAMAVVVAREMAKDFDAVGLFTDAGYEPELEEMSLAVRGAGAEWSPPIWVQYVNRMGAQHAPEGTSLLRDRWGRAKEDGATILQFVTWNDYGENTSLAPTYGTGYGFGDLNRRLAHWWKTGEAPTSDEDVIYATYRLYPQGSPIFPFQGNRGVPDADGLEVLTILPEPATVRLPGRGAQGQDYVYEAPAGLYVENLPASPGPVRVEIVRGGAVVTSLDAPEPITDLPYRQDNALQCASTVDAEYWAEDFSGVPYPDPLNYADKDHDGLPNWFERYWFAGKAEPDADPDGDGQSNLEEYLGQSDPTRAPFDYTAGYVWKLHDINKREFTFNPDRDNEGTPCWYYFVRPSEEESLSFSLTSRNPLRIMGHFEDPAAFLWQEGHLELRPSPESDVAVAWESPVTGEVGITIESDPVRSGRTVNCELWRSGDIRPLWKQTVNHGDSVNLALDNIDIFEGEKLFFVLLEDSGNGRLLLSKMEVRLLE